MGFLVKVILALAVVAGGVWAYVTFRPLPAPVAVETTQQEAQAPAPEVQQPKVNDGGISVSGSTDAALSTDLQALDSQATAAESSSADLDSSFKDQPIQQTE